MPSGTPRPSTIWPRLNLDRILAFNNCLLRLAADDSAVHKLVMEVQHLLRPRSILQEPDLVERIGARVNAGSTNLRMEEP